MMDRWGLTLVALNVLLATTGCVSTAGYSKTTPVDNSIATFVVPATRGVCIALLPAAQNSSPALLERAEVLLSEHFRHKGISVFKFAGDGSALLSACTSRNPDQLLETCKTPSENLLLFVSTAVTIGPEGSWDTFSGEITSKVRRTEVSLTAYDVAARQFVWRAVLRERKDLSRSDAQFRELLDQALQKITKG
jgi:hypothetical protein